jgi:hypothetical protein
VVSATLVFGFLRTKRFLDADRRDPVNEVGDANLRSRLPRGYPQTTHDG